MVHNAHAVTRLATARLLRLDKKGTPVGRLSPSLLQQQAAIRCQHGTGGNGSIAITRRVGVSVKTHVKECAASHNGD